MIIVRDQSAKEKLPEFMKTMLCLTVYESKGLEFDDVILYNFFASGETSAALWKLLNKIQEKRKIRRGYLPDWILDIQPGEQEAFVEAAVAEAVIKHREAKKAAADEAAGAEELKNEADLRNQAVVEALAANQDG